MCGSSLAHLSCTLAGWPVSQPVCSHHTIAGATCPGGACPQPTWYRCLPCSCMHAAWRGREHYVVFASPEVWDFQLNIQGLCKQRSVFVCAVPIKKWKSCTSGLAKTMRRGFPSPKALQQMGCWQLPRPGWQVQCIAAMCSSH